MVEYFTPVPSNYPNPFSLIKEPDMQVHLRLEVTSSPRLTHISELISHCAWIVYNRKEVHYLLDIKSIGLVSLDR